MSEFAPFCSWCASPLPAAPGDLLLSCGHFACAGCASSGVENNASVQCKACGALSRLAPFLDPPAEAKDFLGSVEKQLQSVQDVVKFQLANYKTAATTLKARCDDEIKRRLAAEKEICRLRQAGAGEGRTPQKQR
ncbi:unnamed protein product, partial [Phaeothamnion confervicola]